MSDPRIYLDHAATTPPDPEVVRAMLPLLQQQWHNPSSIYVEGQAAARLLEQARARIAAAIGAQPGEIVCTSGGSESNNLALRGVIEAAAAAANADDAPPHLITTQVEHHALLDPAEQLERDGRAEVTLIAPRPDGRIDPRAVADAVRPNTALVSVMHANNEVGALSDIAEIARLVRERNPRALVHTDAVQSAAHLGVDVRALGVDLLTLTAHKLYGPRGAGALYVRAGTPLAPQVLGGGQEDGRRAGTENVAAIAGFARALELAAERREADIAHERRLQARLLRELPALVPMTAVTGPTDLDRRLPGSASVAVAYVEGESILLALDLAGIAASSGSACSTGSVEPSHVLTAMGLPAELARGSLRFTVGRGNTDAEVDRLLGALPPIVERLRALSPTPIAEPAPEVARWLHGGELHGGEPGG